ncbi:DUF11 domain-containing protein, partial [Schaalia hyovaginalis]|nr:DUF11 domain-containing protein [Schaalia hyovaginalis]
MSAIALSSILAGGSLVMLGSGSHAANWETWSQWERPGQPGVAPAKEQLFWEAFENRKGDWQMLADYVGEPVNGKGYANSGTRYASDPYWQSDPNCTGLLFDANLNPKPASLIAGQVFCGAYADWFSEVKQLVGILSEGNSKTAVASYTTGDAVPPADGIQIRTADSTPVKVPGRVDRFLTYGIDVAAVNCYNHRLDHTHPLLAFSYKDAKGVEHVLADKVDENGNIRDTALVNGKLPSWLANPNGLPGGPSKAFFNRDTPPATGTYFSNAEDPWFKTMIAKGGRYAEALGVNYFTVTDPFLINPCSDPGSTRSLVDYHGWSFRDVASGSYVAHAAFLNEGDTVDVIVRNRTASGRGNDGAINNLRVFDVTPQLDIQFGEWNAKDPKHEGGDPSDRETLEFGQPSTITYTITNRDDHGSKFGWTFDNSLPEDLRFVGAPSFTCDGADQTRTINPTEITAEGSTISVKNGFIPEGGKVCTITVPVAPSIDPYANALNDARDNHRTYTVDRNQFSSVRGLDMPNPASITWFNDKHVDVAKKVDAGADLHFGDTVTFTLEATNDGKKDFTTDSPFIVWDDYTNAADDAELLEVKTTDPERSVTQPQPGKIKWSGALKVGEKATLTYTMKVKEGGDGTGTNVAFAPSVDNRLKDDPPTPDCAVGDGDDAKTGESCAVAEFRPRSVTITKSSDKTSVNSGETVAYTLTATNPSKGAYTDEHPLVLTDDLTKVLPHGEYMGDAKASLESGELVYNGKDQTLVWTGALAPQEALKVTYTVKYVGKGPESLINTVSVPAKEATPGTKPSASNTVTGPTPVPTGSDVTSSGPQGRPQTGQPAFDGGSPSTPITLSATNPAKLIDPATGEATDSPTVPAYDSESGAHIGTYTIDPLTGIVTFTPKPTYVGTAEPATVQAQNTLGAIASGTYTPSVTPVIPAARPASSEGKQGQPQTGTPTFIEGDPGVKITSVKLIDPTTGQPSDEASVPAMKGGAQVGTYTYDPTSGVVTFQPNPDFIGMPEPARVQARDANGTPVETTYQPNVTPVVPTGTGATSTGPQGESQSGVPSFVPGDDRVPVEVSASNPVRFIDPETNEPTDETSIPAVEGGRQVGVYTIDPSTGVVTFRPNPDFVGSPLPAQVQARDANGTPARASYQPEVTPLNPSVEDSQSEEIQGFAQSGTPSFKDGEGGPLLPSAENPARLIDPSTGQPTEKTSVPAYRGGGPDPVGEYSIDPSTGVVTFSPNKDFVGEPNPVKVQLRDKNGTPATGSYQPKVTPVVPKGESAASTGAQGESQSGVPSFVPGDDRVPVEVSASNPVRFIDPETNEPTDETSIPAVEGGRQVGVYT